MDSHTDAIFSARDAIAARPKKGSLNHGLLGRYRWECSEPFGGGHDGMHGVLYGDGTFYRCRDCGNEIGNTRREAEAERGGSRLDGDYSETEIH